MECTVSAFTLLLSPCVITLDSNGLYLSVILVTEWSRLLYMGFLKIEFV